MRKSTEKRMAGVIVQLARIWACVYRGVYRVEGSSPGLSKNFHENYLCFMPVRIATAILIRSSIHVVRANPSSDIERLTSMLT